MLAFEVADDGELLCVAGIEDWAVLHAGISGVRRGRGHAPDRDEVNLDVGGLSETNATGASYHSRWKGLRSLQVGTTVTIKILETDRVDEPVRRYRSDKEVQEPAFTVEELEEFEREDYARLKAKFEP